MITSKEIPKEGTEETQVVVTIDNGDLQLVKSLIGAYSLKDSTSFIKFAIASLLQANNNEGLFTIKTIDDTDGSKKKVLSQIAPTPDMVQTPTTN